MAGSKPRCSIKTPKVELCNLQGTMQLTPEFHLSKLGDLKIEADMAAFEPPRTPVNTPKASEAAGAVQMMLSPDLFANISGRN